VNCRVTGLVAGAEELFLCEGKKRAARRPKELRHRRDYATNA
jgi:hypothetical protein